MDYIEKKPLCAWLENMGVSAYIIDTIKNEEHFPTADVVEVKHGKWIEIVKDIGKGRTITHYQCSLCDVYTAKELNYCPNCGAKMDSQL